MHVIYVKNNVTIARYKLSLIGLLHNQLIIFAYEVMDLRIYFPSTCKTLHCFCSLVGCLHIE